LLRRVVGSIKLKEPVIVALLAPIFSPWVSNPVSGKSRLFKVVPSKDALLLILWKVPVIVPVTGGTDFAVQDTPVSAAPQGVLPSEAVPAVDV